MEHETPTIELFNEIKEASIRVWNTMDNAGGYVDENLERINSIENYADNAMTFYTMFDFYNQLLMRIGLSQEALNYINDNY